MTSSPAPAISTGPVPDPKQAVDRKQPGPTGPLARKNVQLMTEGEVLYSSTTSRLRNRRATPERVERTSLSISEHYGRESKKTLRFSALSEFPAGTRIAVVESLHHYHVRM
jgi:hypothetical protein